MGTILSKAVDYLDGLNEGNEPELSVADPTLGEDRASYKLYPFAMISTAR